MERYLDTDLEDIYYGRKTFEDIARKYNSKPINVRKAFWKRGYKLNKRYFIIKDMFAGTTLWCYTIREVMNALQISRQSVYRLIKGEKIKLLERMNIEVEVHYYGEK